jgi:hypothetical protein
MIVLPGGGYTEHAGPQLHMFTHGPHSLGLAHGAGEPEIWTTLARLPHSRQPGPGEAGGPRPWGPW